MSTGYPTLYRCLCAAWAATLAGLFLVLALDAAARNASLWMLEELEQDGQLTIYNSIPSGGFLGMPVELGDYDGDGSVDLAVAPMAANLGPGDERENAGHVYVYRGDGRISGILDRDDLPEEKRGLTLSGERDDDLLGTELFTADIDGNGIDDLILSAQNYDGPQGDRDNAGGVYVVFGRPGLLAKSRVIDLRDRGPGILRITGGEPGERLGIWVEAGDLDGDGIQDLLLGADQHDSDPGSPLFHRGKVYILYGRTEYPDEIDLASFQEDVTTILGRDIDDHLGSSIHARDLNADGRDDLILGVGLNRLSASISGDSAFEAHSTAGGDGPFGDRLEAGEVYVLFGPEEGGRLPPLIDLSEPLPPALSERLTTIYGAKSLEVAGEELTTGDFNGDGFPDLVIGALTGDYPAPQETRRVGRAYVLYWGKGLEGATIDLAPEPEFPLPEGLVISLLHGARTNDVLGDTLAAGDLDHDGLDDLAVGIPHAVVNGRSRVGMVAVVFGRKEPFPAVFAPQAFDLPEQLRVTRVLGHRPGDLMSYSMEIRDYDGDGYDDLYPNAMRGESDPQRQTDAGAAYVVSGFHLSGAQLRVDRVEPAAVLPGGDVEIIGDGFTTREDSRVTLGGDELAEFEVVSRSRMTARLPGDAVPGRRLSLSVENRHGKATLDDALRIHSPEFFIRGDSDLDFTVDISDPIRTLTVLFLGAEFICRDSDDANDDARVDLSDAIYTLRHLFLGGPPPRPPYPDPGADPTADDLGCEL
ncbi:MAG: FG-GAP-like repeat-containing protein [Planctomycetota bacterium]|nr:FG-GAP-like repeat-containing protein [Planctomycetota bacterium]